MDEAFAHIEGNGRRHCKKNMIPPDGGWGYVVCVGVGFTFMLGFGSSNAFGILFHNFFTEQGSGSGLPLVIGVYNGALSISGFLSGIALKKYSFRQVGLVGAGLFVLGDVLTIFVQRTYQLVFTFGVVRGAGFGVMIPVSFTAFNCYFTKRRTAMMSANQTMSSMASITFPVLVTYLLAEYGFRWTLALIMAVDLHLVFAMLVMHPVEWHLVKNPEAYQAGSSHCANGCTFVLNSALGGTKRRVWRTGTSLENLLDELTNPLPSKCDVLSVSRIKFDHDESIIKMLPGDDEEVKEKIPKIHESIQKSIIKMICKNVELDLLKDPRFVSTLVGLGFAFVSDVTYLAMEPMLLFSYGFSKMEVATCVMVGAIADLVARFLLAVFTFFYAVDSRKIFFGGTCITILLRIALVSSSELWYVFAVTVVSGIVRCSVQVLFPLVLATAAPDDRFPAALALHIIFSGILMLIADPLIGVIYEATGSYTYCFLAMSFCCMVCVVLWTIEYIIYRKNRH